jgi:Na+/pantothenate symporter
LVPLVAAFLGVRSNGRAFRYALLSGLSITLLWNYVWVKPWGVDGAVVGMFVNLIVFLYNTRIYNQHRIQHLQMWQQS